MTTLLAFVVHLLLVLGSSELSPPLRSSAMSGHDADESQAQALALPSDHQPHQAGASQL